MAEEFGRFLWNKHQGLPLISGFERSEIKCEILIFFALGASSRLFFNLSVTVAPCIPAISSLEETSLAKPYRKEET